MNYYKEQERNSKGDSWDISHDIFRLWEDTKDKKQKDEKGGNMDEGPVATKSGEMMFSITSQ